MKNTTRKTIEKIDERRKGLFWALTCFLFALSTMYVYYVNTAALNGVRWEEAERRTADLETEVSRLEGRYLSIQKGITLAHATELGFVDARGVVFLRGMPKVSLRAE